MFLYFQNQSSEFLCTKSVSQNLISAMDAGHLWAIRTSLGTSKSHIFSQLLAGKVVPEWSKCSLSMANVTLSRFTLVLKKLQENIFENVFFENRVRVTFWNPILQLSSVFRWGYQRILNRFGITFWHKMSNYLAKIRLK